MFVRSLFVRTITRILYFTGKPGEIQMYSTEPFFQIFKKVTFIYVWKAVEKLETCDPA